MNFRRQFQEEIADQGQKIAKAASLPLIPAVVITGQILVLWFSRQDHLFPDNDALMTVISCCAQIIAGLYGITLAGYTFFLSRMDGLMATDATLDYIVRSVKLRFKQLIWYITMTVAVTLFISVFLMYYPVSSGVIPDYLYRVICNEFILFLVFSTALILYYSVGVVDPNCLEKEAKKLKKKLGGQMGALGSTVEFIALYDKIERRCNGMLPENVLGQIHRNKGRQFEYTIALLEEQNDLPYPIIGEIRRIQRYYECVVNCSSLRVSQEMCNQARKVLAFLEQPTQRIPDGKRR